MSDSRGARRRPEKTEYFEYYEVYIGLVPDGDIIEILRSQLVSSLEFYRSIPEGKIDHRYEPGKWSTKEVIGHLIDIEWIFTHRALRFARGDRTPLSGIDQNDLMAGANFEEIGFHPLIEEFHHLRSANIILFDSFSEGILDRIGTASGYEFTVRSIPHILAGHELHHLRVLRERYL